MGAAGTGISKEQTAMSCCTPMTSIKRWSFIIMLVLFFIAFCTVVFSGEQESPVCDQQSGLPANLNLSREQCINIKQLADRFRNDTATTRAKIMEKRLALRSLAENPKTDPNDIHRVERELNDLEQKFAIKARQTEYQQRKYLYPEQIDKINNMQYGYSPH